MITIKMADYTTILFKELKPGDIFSFVYAPDTIYIKTARNFPLNFECEECNEETTVDLDDFCVALETGNFFEGNPFEKVIPYRKAELSLER